MRHPKPDCTPTSQTHLQQLSPEAALELAAWEIDRHLEAVLSANGQSEKHLAQALEAISQKATEQANQHLKESWQAILDAELHQVLADAALARWDELSQAIEAE